MIYTITENEFYFYDTKLEVEKWVKQYQFWYGVLDDVDFKTDYRFCEIKNRRKLAKLMGTKDVVFPVEFPLVLDNGVILNEHEKFKYNNENENEEF